MNTLDKVTAAMAFVDGKSLPIADYKAMARAAVEALREPSPRMIAATLPLEEMPLDRDTILLSEKALCFLEQEGFPASGHAAGVESAQRLIADWRGMIDAALQEA